MPMPLLVIVRPSELGVTDPANQLGSVDALLRSYLSKTHGFKAVKLGGASSGFLIRKSFNKIKMEKFWLEAEKAKILGNNSAQQQLWKEMFPEYEGVPPVGRGLSPSRHSDDFLPIDDPRAKEALRLVFNEYEEYKKRLWQQVRKEILSLGKLRDSTCEQVGSVAHNKVSDKSTAVLYETGKQEMPKLTEAYYVAVMEVNI